MKAQLKELASNDMIKTLFPNLSKIGAICLSIPVTTASVERSFSQMKLIKTRLRRSLNDKSLSNLMKIALESPDECLQYKLCMYKHTVTHTHMHFIVVVSVSESLIYLNCC